MAGLKSLTTGKPAARKKLVSAIDAMLYRLQVDMENMLPAIVVAYDRDSNMATVRPIIMNVDVNDNRLTRYELSKIPVLSIGGGGFHISFPIKQGDLGWIHASDRDLSLFKQSLQDAAPSNGILHKFGNGMFIPDVFRQYTIDAEDEDAMVIQTTDSKVRISLHNDHIKMTTPVSVILDTPLTELSGDLLVGGNTVMQGQVIMDKTLNVAEETTTAGIDFTTHGHISNTPGQRTIDGAIP